MIKNIMVKLFQKGSKKIVSISPDKEIPVYLCSQGDKTLAGENSIPSGIAWTISQTHKLLYQLGYNVKIYGVSEKSYEKIQAIFPEANIEMCDLINDIPNESVTSDVLQFYYPEIEEHISSVETFHPEYFKYQLVSNIISTHTFRVLPKTGTLNVSKISYHTFGPGTDLHIN